MADLKAIADSLKVIACDCFGTVFDLSRTSQEERSDYIAQVRRDYWAPLSLPDAWQQLEAHPDARAGLERLRTRYWVVTCSNAPLGFLARLSSRNDIRWDAIIPLEMRKVYKPHPEAYKLVYDVMGVRPEETLMVTGNVPAIDVQGAELLGMHGQLIRHLDEPQTLIELAEQLGC